MIAATGATKNPGIGLQGFLRECNGKAVPSFPPIGKPLLFSTPMPLNRRDFLKLAAASALAAPLPCLSGQEPPRALWLQRDKEWA